MTIDPELVALTNVCAALNDIDDESKLRVLEYAIKKFNLDIRLPSAIVVTQPQSPIYNPQPHAIAHSSAPSLPTEELLGSEESPDDFDDDDIGISPVAIKWMKRNSLTMDQLGHLFSLGVDEIDLVASSVPGSSKNQRTRSVILLKGMAAYLGSGAARISAEQIKTTLLHYDAYDPPNHAKYIRGLASEVSGNKKSGYTLTVRGMTSATEIIQSLVQTES